MELYNLENKEDLFAFHEINKEALNNLLEARQKNYEDKSKTNNEFKNEELS